MASTKVEKLSQKAIERKNNKPIMEKKRRARINYCLNQLKSLILETNSERSRHSKLEKADILEMTVRYLQTLRTYHSLIGYPLPLNSADTTATAAAAAAVAAASATNYGLNSLQSQLNLSQQQIPIQCLSGGKGAWRPW